MPHVFALSSPFLGQQALGRPARPPVHIMRQHQTPSWMESPSMRFSGAAEGLGNVLGDVGGETVRVIGMSAIGLALGYAAAYVLFMRGR